MQQPRLVVGVLAAITLVLVAGCGRQNPSDSLTPPENGLCRVISLNDLSARTNDSPAVLCETPHTAQTIKVGTFPRSVGSNYQASPVGRFAYKTCGPAFAKYLGASDSQVPRVQLSWAWFGPTQRAWDQGARWFRCDIVGTSPSQTTMVNIPEKLKNLLLGFPPDQWLTCASGASFGNRVEVACNKPHTWRLVTAVKLGQPNDPYPGDHVSQVRAKDYCSDAIAAYFNYANNYEFATTVFHAAEWKAGNRRALCWGKTSK